MNKQIFISDKELKTYGSTDTLSDKAAALLLHQKDNWDLVKNNFTNLIQIKTKSFDFGNYKLKLQFNPARIVSSSAKVDKRNIKARACFLCKENLPPEQKGIKYADDYLILINPFPVFEQHLTIPKLLHTPQSIKNTFTDLLNLSYDLRHNFFVFYNGPACGASAPDHHHFQAAIKNSTPLEKEYKEIVIRNGKQIFNNQITEIFSVTNYLRNFIYISSKSKQEANSYFLKLLSALSSFSNEEIEPKLNIISLYENNQWNIFIFPRAKHRPKQYFFEDNRKILFSPAAAEMSGVCIFPREEDFIKVTKNDLVDMFNQVSFSKENLNSIAKLL